MKSPTEKYSKSIITCIALCLACLVTVSGQKLLSYGPEERTAAVHYSWFLYSIYKSLYDTLPNYPVKGAYSPTGYGLTGRNRDLSPMSGIYIGNGTCNYIYVPTHGVLQPGHQYRISLTVKVAESYKQMKFYRDHFGVALVSDLIENNIGLWSKPFVHLSIKTTAELATIEFVFRPLCTSEYLVLGVFEGLESYPTSYFAVQYGFELHNLLVEVWDDPNAEFVYMCDVFEEERLKKKFASAFDTDTVYFDSGSAEVQEEFIRVLDSIPSKLKTKQDLITLSAYTDKEGTDNEKLGAARNTAVREALIERGVDTNRILMVNHGETKASNRISQEDRRVEIDMNRGMLFQKYYTEALLAATRGEYGIAQGKMNQWLKMVPPENAIYAIFDCWGEEEKGTKFRNDLTKSIRSKYFYKGKELKFTLDSLYCEDQKGRTLSMYLRLNYLPDFRGDCYYAIDSLRNLDNQRMIDHFYSKHGFPTVEEVGARGNQTLPYMILHARDTTFQKQYLPIVQKACEDQLISWDYYAMLYDKIGIVRNGHQRYGTQWMVDKNGVLSGLFPFEDEKMVGEYRKRVGLPSLSDF